MEMQAPEGQRGRKFYYIGGPGSCVNVACEKHTNSTLDEVSSLVHCELQSTRQIPKGAEVTAQYTTSTGDAYEQVNIDKDIPCGIDGCATIVIRKAEK